MHVTMDDRKRAAAGYEEYCREMIDRMAEADPDTREVVDMKRNQQRQSNVKMMRCFHRHILALGLAKGAELGFDYYIRHVARAGTP